MVCSAARALATEAAPSRPCCTTRRARLRARSASLALAWIEAASSSIDDAASDEAARLPLARSRSAPARRSATTLLLRATRSALAAIPASSPETPSAIWSSDDTSAPTSSRDAALRRRVRSPPAMSSASEAALASGRTMTRCAIVTTTVSRATSARPLVTSIVRCRLSASRCHSSVDSVMLTAAATSPAPSAA